MQEMTLTEMQQVSGAGTRIGTNGSGDGGNAIGDAVPTPFGGGIRVGSDGANTIATPILF